MKFSIALSLILTVLEANAAHATSNIIFVCSLEDGRQILVERDATDIFTLTYGEDLEYPQVLVQKAGNDLGTSYHHSRVEGASSREQYVTAKDLMFTIGADDHSGVRTGYLWINQAGVQKSTSNCINGTLFNTFDDFDLFVNLTEVD